MSMRWPWVLAQSQLQDRSLTRVGLVTQGGNTSPNFQQPYYQVHVYGPGNQPVPDAFFPRPSATPLATGDAYPGMSENVREQVA
jgi:hypothetical protein